MFWRPCDFEKRAGVQWGGVGVGGGGKSACDVSSGHFDERQRSYFLELRPQEAKGIDQSRLEPRTGPGRELCVTGSFCHTIEIEETL